MNSSQFAKWDKIRKISIFPGQSWLFCYGKNLGYSTICEASYLRKRETYRGDRPSKVLRCLSHTGWLIWRFPVGAGNRLFYSYKSVAEHIIHFLPGQKLDTIFGNCDVFQYHGQILQLYVDSFRIE